MLLRNKLSLKVETFEREAEKVTRACPSVNLTLSTTVATVAPAKVTTLMVTVSDDENEATLVVQVRVVCRPRGRERREDTALVRIEPVMRVITEVEHESSFLLPSRAVALTVTGATVSLRLKTVLSRESWGKPQLSEAKETGAVGRTVEEKGATERVTLIEGLHSITGSMLSGLHSHASPTLSWS